MVGHVVFGEDPREDLHGGLELLRDHGVRPEGDQVVHVRHQPRPHQDEEGGVAPAGDRHRPPRGHRVGDRQDEDPRARDPQPVQYLGPVDVAVEHRLPGGLPLAHFDVVQVHDHVRQPRRPEHAGQVLPVHPVARDYDVVLHAGLPDDGILFRFRKLGPAHHPPLPALRDRGGRAHQERRHRHRQDGDGQQELVLARTHEVLPVPLGEEEKGELPDLQQPDAGDHGHPRRVAQCPDRPPRGNRLDQGDRRHHGQHQREVRQEEWKVQEHAHRDEEDPVEDVPERQNLGRDLVDVVRLGDHHPREKRTHPQRKAEPVRKVGGAEAHQQHGHGEDLPAVQPDDFLEEAGDEEPRQQEQHRNPGAGLRQGQEDGGELGRFPLAKGGDEKHHRDHRHVLEQQDPERQPPVHAVDFQLVGVHLQDDRRAGEGDDEAHEDRLGDGRPGKRQDHEGKKDRGENLRPAGPQHLPPHLPQAGKRDLQPDGEQEQDDADLRKRLDHPLFGDQSRSRRPHDRPRNEERRHHREAEPAEEERNRGGDRQDDGQVAQDGGKFQRHSLAGEKGFFRKSLPAAREILQPPGTSAWDFF